MIPAVLVPLLLSHFSGDFDGEEHRCLYVRAGAAVTLPCLGGRGCAGSPWTYRRGEKNPLVIHKGETTRFPPGAEGGVMRVEDDCSLIVTNVTGHNSGRYSCSRLNEYNAHFLNVLTVSSSPSHGGDLQLTCSMDRFFHPKPVCRGRKVRWVNQDGLELSNTWCGGKQTSCQSNLSVTNNSSSTFTCQVVDDYNYPLVQGRFSPIIKENKRTASTDSPALDGSSDWPPLRCIMVTLRITALVLMVFITVVIVRDTGCLKEKRWR